MCLSFSRVFFARRILLFGFDLERVGAGLDLVAVFRGPSNPAVVGEVLLLRTSLRYASSVMFTSHEAGE